MASDVLERWNVRGLHVVFFRLTHAIPRIRHNWRGYTGTHGTSDADISAGDAIRADARGDSRSAVRIGNVRLFRSGGFARRAIAELDDFGERFDGLISRVVRPVEVFICE